MKRILQKIWGTVRLNQAAFWHNKKLMPFFFFLICTLWMFTDGIKGYAATLGVGVTPWLFPLYFISYMGRQYGILLLILLLCDAPFSGQNYTFTVKRSGRICWGCGQIIHIITATVTYLLLFMLCSVVMLIPYVAFSGDWGVVIRELSADPAPMANENGGLMFSWQNEVVSAYTPLQAMLMESVLILCFGLLFGLIIFIMNGLTKSLAGTITVLSIFFSYTILEDLFLFLEMDIKNMKLFYYLNLQYVLIDSGTGFAKTVLILMMANVLLIAVALYLTRRGLICVREK